MTYTIFFINLRRNTLKFLWFHNLNDEKPLGFQFLFDEKCIKKQQEQVKNINSPFGFFHLFSKDHNDLEALTKVYSFFPNVIYWKFLPCRSSCEWYGVSWSNQMPSQLQSFEVLSTLYLWLFDFKLFMFTWPLWLATELLICEGLGLWQLAERSLLVWTWVMIF